MIGGEPNSHHPQCFVISALVSFVSLSLFFCNPLIVTKSISNQVTDLVMVYD